MTIEAPYLQVVGVGTKSLAEAAHHNTFDLSTLGTWQAGKPVPFAFLADAFEAIAQVMRCSTMKLCSTLACALLVLCLYFGSNSDTHGVLECIGVLMTP